MFVNSEENTFSKNANLDMENTMKGQGTGLYECYCNGYLIRPFDAPDFC
jgi:hypothetical protein